MTAESKARNISYIPHLRRKTLGIDAGKPDLKIKCAIAPLLARACGA